LNAGTALIDPKGNIFGKSYFRNPDVNKGYYSKKREDVHDIDPKVSINLTYLGHGAIRTNPWKTSKKGGY